MAKNRLSLAQFILFLQNHFVATTYVLEINICVLKIYVYVTSLSLTALGSGGGVCVCARVDLLIARLSAGATPDTSPIWGGFLCSHLGGVYVGKGVVSVGKEGVSVEAPI